MITIWKFKINLGRNEYGKFYIEIPRVHNILSVKKQGTNLYIWAEVDTNPKITTIKKYFWKIGTGKERPDKILRFIDTIIDIPFVWHIYEE